MRPAAKSTTINLALVAILVRVLTNAQQPTPIAIEDDSLALSLPPLLHSDGASSSLPPEFDSSSGNENGPDTHRELAGSKSGPHFPPAASASDSSVGDGAAAGSAGSSMWEEENVSMMQPAQLIPRYGHFMGLVGMENSLFSWKCKQCCKASCDFDQYRNRWAACGNCEVSATALRRFDRPTCPKGASIGYTGSPSGCFVQLCGFALSNYPSRSMSRCYPWVA